MQIILMRHGEPEIDVHQRRSGVEMQQWIQNYDLSTVRKDSDIPAAEQNIANSAKYVICSTAPRTRSSVDALGLTAQQIDQIFCEAELPVLAWHWPRLNPAYWLVIFRLLWWFGFSRGVESFQLATRRAHIAAQKLIMLSQHGSVLLLGHGFMNRLIAKELKQLGWQRHQSSGSGYWHCAVFEPILPKID